MNKLLVYQKLSKYILNCTPHMTRQEGYQNIKINCHYLIKIRKTLDALAQLYETEDLEVKVYGEGSLQVAKTQKIIGTILLLVQVFRDALNYFQNCLITFEENGMKKAVAEVKQKIKCVKEMKEKGKTQFNLIDRIQCKNIDQISSLQHNSINLFISLIIFQTFLEQKTLIKLINTKFYIQNLQLQIFKFFHNFLFKCIQPFNKINNQMRQMTFKGTQTGRRQIKKSFNIDVILKQIFLRAEYFTQRYIFCYSNQKNFVPLIRSIYRVLLIPDNWVKQIQLSHKALLYLIVHLKFAKKGIHPLQEYAYEKLQIILQQIQ